MRTVFGLARRVVMFEVTLYRSLLRWVTRRPHIPSGATPFSYVGAVAAVMWAFIIVSAIELVAVHLLLPWETIRLIADLLSIWGLVWMLGLLASFKVHPHLVGDSGLQVRSGSRTDITVPWEAVATVAVRMRSRDKSKALQLDRDDQGTVLNVVTGSQTNVDLTFHRPLVVQLPKGTETITELRLYADDARGLVNRAGEYLAGKDEPEAADAPPHRRTSRR